jgi:hypothetical protein
MAAALLHPRSMSSARDILGVPIGPPPIEGANLKNCSKFVASGVFLECTYFAQLLSSKLNKNPNHVSKKVCTYVSRQVIGIKSSIPLLKYFTFYEIRYVILNVKKTTKKNKQKTH